MTPWWWQPCTTAADRSRPSSAQTLAIGATEPVTIPLDKQIPAGPWHAQVNLASGLIHRSAGATITFPAAGTSTAVSTRQGLSWIIIIIIILLIVIVLLLLGTIYLLVAPDDVVILNPPPSPRASRVGTSLRKP